jgi:Fe-S-cluster containining protein
MDTPTVEDVLEQYRILCEWCDRFYDGVHGRLGAHMRCGKGCWFCCTMKAIAPLEAHLIREYLADFEPDELPSGVREPRSGSCVLLVDKACFVYPVRPAICRTHGAPMRREVDRSVGSCLMNFEGVDLDALGPELVLDERRMAENLMRLNIAYCRLSGLDDDPDARVSFEELLREARAGL